MIRQFSDKLLRIRIIHDEREVRLGFLATGIIMLLLLLNVVYLNIIVIRSSTAANTSVPAASDEKVLTPTSRPTPPPSQVAASDQKSTQEAPTLAPSKRDYYVNLGYGTNRSTEWEDVTGTILTLDIASYKNIREVRLESTISVPTANGTVSVRLYNKTDGYAVWNSERTVVAEAQIPLLISEKLNYDHGAKLYSVQMKSQLGVQADLVQARLHIVAE